MSQKKAAGPPAYTRVFGEAVVQIARQFPTVIGITAAMPDGTGLDALQRELPERFYDVGIAEQHSVTFCRRPGDPGMHTHRGRLFVVLAARV